MIGISGNEPSGFIKGRKLIVQLSEYYIFCSRELASYLAVIGYIKYDM
jgi:hypothetical protein